MKILPILRKNLKDLEYVLIHLRKEIQIQGRKMTIKIFLQKGEVFRSRHFQEYLKIMTVIKIKINQKWLVTNFKRKTVQNNWKKIKIQIDIQPLKCLTIKNYVSKTMRCLNLRKHWEKVMNVDFLFKNLTFF